MLRVLFIHQNLPGQFRRGQTVTRVCVELKKQGRIPRPPEGYARYREALCAGLGERRHKLVGWSRVHFLGKLPYASYRTVLQVSSLHIYLTYPFVLSWSVPDAMAVGLPACLELLKPLRQFAEEGDR